MTREEALLARATGALRDSGQARVSGAASTRARVVRRVRLRHASRRLALVLVALAFVFVGVPGAWALATGRTPAWVEPILRVLASDLPATSVRGDVAAAPARTRREPTLSAAQPPLAVAQRPTAEQPSAATPPPTPATPAQQPSLTVPRTLRRVGPRVEEPRGAALDPDALYREAHALHFVARDASGALAAWERYLAAAPDGRFALEARYNRALDLVRLGRIDAARQALGPFASGELDGYRQQEASALLAALDTSRSTP